MGTLPVRRVAVRIHWLKAAGVKISPTLIGQNARTVMNDAPLSNSNFIDPFDDKPIVDKIKTPWVQQLMVYSIFTLEHT